MYRYFQGYSLPECIVFSPISFAPIFVYSIQIYLFLCFMDDLQKKKINMRSYNVHKKKNNLALIPMPMEDWVQPQNPCRLWLTGVATIYYGCFQLSLKLPNWEVNSRALQSGLYLLRHFALTIRSDRSALAFKDLCQGQIISYQLLHSNQMAPTPVL